jgi:5'-nucleotidase/UDP-sugar diphosphatase
MTSVRTTGLIGMIAVALASGCSSSSSNGADAAVTADAASDASAASDGAVTDVGGGDVPTTTQSFTILHTNDLHSHLMGFGPEADYSPATTGDDTTVGGLARLAARVKAERAAAGAAPVLLLDAGDYMMGTPFEILATGAAAELVEMNKLKFDATTIGNHELDWGPTGLAAILKAATDKGFAIPIVATNMGFSATDPGDDDLEKFQTAGLIGRKLIKDVGGIKVGIIGLLGQNAALVSPLKKPLTFQPIAATAAAAVMELRQVDKVDLVIALSHSGIDPMGNGEDRKLADDAAVIAAGGIDVIVSGHTHDTLPAPIHTGKTWIVQAGSYGRFLGRMQLTATKSSAGTTLAVDKYDLLPIDDTVAGDTATQASVDAYIAAIDALLAPAMLTYKQVLAETSVDIGATPYVESGLGDLVTDAYLNVTKALQPMAPPVIAIDASGDIRDDIKKGKMGRLWLADLFRVEPLGIGPNNQPGYPLVTFYINGHDIQSGLELSAGAKTLGSPDYLLQVSGLTVQWKESAPLFQRVMSVKIGDTAVNLTDTTTCYKVVTNLYVASLLSLVKDLTGGLYSVVPKASDCTTVITDLTSQIVDANPLTPAVDELKEWQAMVGFVSKLPDTDGNMIPNIPASYGTPGSRITIVP